MTSRENRNQTEAWSLNKSIYELYLTVHLSVYPPLILNIH